MTAGGRELGGSPLARLLVLPRGELPGLDLKGQKPFPSTWKVSHFSSATRRTFQPAFTSTGVYNFSIYPRFGTRAGQPNQHFLDADLFQRAFLTPCETVRPKVGLLIFEFSRFYPAD